MKSGCYYYLATLPALGELGSAPPIEPVELMELLADYPRLSRLVGAVLISDDLLQREAFLAGDREESDSAVLSRQQVRDEAPLPDYLTARSRDREVHVIQSDAIWESYFHYAAETGEAGGSRLLTQWVQFEATLRNALAAARAERLELDKAGYMVAEDLTDAPDVVAAVVSAWAAAPTPLAGLRAVIAARWDWLRQHDPWFSFSEDELVAYAARLMLLEQWHRSSPKSEPTGNSAA
ncbi:MAG: DUF2764 family protein [Pirellulaceae bacterium]|nr:DUF2764 family protein [Pirellulaceae bacterium]